jgi:lysophospholipase L1-like esterase
MTQLYIFIYLLRYFLILCFATTATAQYKIMFLGNSITQGNQYHPGYKYKLWQMLVDAQTDVELVGSHDMNEGGSPSVKGTLYKGKTYTNRNEGHWGWSADEILNGRDGKGNLSEWLQGYTPDIVLMHLGTNDMFRQCASPSCYQETVKELKEVVRQIRMKNPNAIIMVAKLLPAYIQKVGPEAANNIEMLNKMIPAMVKELNTPTSLVVLADQYDRFDPTTGIDTHDGVHPNANGELKMARKWFAALQPYITP